MRSEYSVIETAGLQSMMGVLFWPGGARPFLELPADEFYNREIPLDLIWGPAAARLRDCLREAGTPSEKFRVLEAALGGGYCDQAHLAHEFRDFSGMSPGAWLSGERPFLNHVVMD